MKNTESNRWKIIKFEGGIFEEMNELNEKKKKSPAEYYSKL